MNGNEPSTSSTAPNQMEWTADNIKEAIELGTKIHQAYLRDTANALLNAGFGISACEWLKDDQIIVSTSIYDAAKLITDKANPKTPSTTPDSK